MLWGVRCVQRLNVKIKYLFLCLIISPNMLLRRSLERSYYNHKDNLTSSGGFLSNIHEVIQQLLWPFHDTTFPLFTKNWIKLKTFGTINLSQFWVTKNLIEPIENYTFYPTPNIRTLYFYSYNFPIQKNKNPLISMYGWGKNVKCI
jgi:hypothetical protein